MSSQSGMREGRPTIPRAVIHKKILDAAESHPRASVEELAADVNGASPELVGRVLEEYGDPADDGDSVENGGPTDAAGADATETQSTMEHAKTNGSVSRSGVQGTDGADETDGEPSELTVKQREVLREIRESPEATQSELAERFGVTQSTINNRLNTIEGFDWKRRREFAAAVLGDADESADEEPAVADGSTDGGRVEPAAPASDPDLLTRIDELAERVGALESRLDDPARSVAEARDEPESPFGEPDLACRVVRACLDAPDITESEENRILRAVVGFRGRT